MIHFVPSASTWSRSRHSEHSGQLPLRSRSSPLGLSSLSPDETQKINEANRALEVAAWVAEQSLQCPSKFIGLNIIFPEDLGRTLYTWSLFHVGTTASFVSLRAYVTLGVQLPTCVSSPDRNTSVRLEFSPTVPVSVLFCFWAGQTWLKFRTVSSTKALCLFPVHVAVSILLLLA